MLKRWAALPQGTRWMIGIAVIVLALAIVWVLFVPAADWLAYHDVGSARGPLHETALDNARGRLLTLGAGLFAAGALVFTARNFALSREGQVTDRYTKAIEQLGSDKLDVRIGGIYALERVARDSARDHPDRDGGSHRIHPRALTRAAAVGRFRRAGSLSDRRGPTCKLPLPWSGAGMQSATSKPLTSPTWTSAARTSAARTSPARTSRARTSTARALTARTSAARSLTARTSPGRTSGTRSSLARTSPTRTSPTPGGPQRRRFRRAGN